VPPSIEGTVHETVEVAQNQTTYLSCPATGIPRPSIIWYRDDVPLFDAAADDQNVRQLDAARRLELRQVRVDDDRVVYRCQANNVAGQTDKRFIVKVLGTSPPFSPSFYVFTLPPEYYYRVVLRSPRLCLSVCLSASLSQQVSKAI